MPTLSTYLQQTSDLLHDQNFLFTPKSQLQRWVNESRRQVAARTGCIRRLITGQSAFGAAAQAGAAIPGAMQPGSLPGAFQNAYANGTAAINSLQTIPGVERYPFRGFFNPYAQQSYAGIKGIVDVASLAVNWGGAVRPTLAWLAWDDLQAYARAYATLLESYPYYWSVYNDGEEGEVWLFPAPSTTGDIEADAFCVPTDLHSDDDFDAIPDGFSNAVKFIAAALAFMSSNRFMQAELMEQMSGLRIGIARVSADRGKVPSYYTGVFG